MSDVQSENILKLKDLFDSVVFDENINERYAALILRDKAINSSFVDWIVWLDIKVAKYSKDSFDSTLKFRLYDNLKKVVDEILRFQDNLFLVKKTSIQLSLFDGIEENRDIKKDIKEIPFLQIANLWDNYNGTYDDTDYVSYLPKSSEEMIEIAKQRILEGIKNPYNENVASGENDFCDEYGYIDKNESLSDKELFDRVMHCMRIHFLPYKSYKHYFADDGNFLHEICDMICHRFYYDYGKLSSHPNYNDEELPQYDLYDQNFIDWLRDTFEIPARDVVEDYVPLDETAKRLFCTMNSHCEPKYDVERIKKLNNYKKFKADFQKHYKKNQFGSIGINGGGSGYSIDGFHSFYSASLNKSNIEVFQNIKFRKSIGRNTDDLEIREFNNDEVFVYNLYGDECYEAIYNAYNRDKKVQKTLLDFM